MNLPRLHVRDLWQWAKQHRLGVFLTAAPLIGLWLYDVAGPDNFDERLRTLTAIATGIGALGLFINLLFTSETVENSRQTLEHQRTSQKDDRFYRATEQLKESEYTRIGALLALERLAAESDDYYDQVIDVVCSFIRIRSEEIRRSLDTDLQNIDPDEVPNAPHDIEVALNVLRRRARRLGDGESEGLDLKGAYLSGLDIRGGDFQKADLAGAALVRTVLHRCNFARAWMAELDARRCTFYETILFATNFFSGADVRHAFFWYEDSVPSLDGLVATETTAGLPPYIMQFYGYEDGESPREVVDGGRYLDHSRWDLARMDGATFACYDLSGMEGLTKQQYRSFSKTQGCKEPAVLFDDTANPNPDDEIDIGPFSSDDE